MKAVMTDARLGEGDGAVIRRLWPFFRPYGPQFLIGSGCGVADSLLQTALIWMLKVAINDAQHVRLTHLVGVLALEMVLVLCKSGFNFAQEFLVFSAGLRSVMHLRNALFAHLQTLSLGFFHRTRTGQLMSRFTSDVRVIEEGVTNNLTNAVTGPCTILFQIGALLWLDWRLSLLAFTLVPVVVVSVQHGSRLMRRASQQRQELMGEVTTVLEESISGVRVVQSFTGEGREIERFRSRSWETYRAAMRGVRIIAVMTPALETLSMFAVLVILWFGAVEIKQERLQISDLFTFVFFLNSVAAAFKQLGRTYTNFQQMLASADRLIAIFDEKPDVVDRPNARPLTRARGELQFEHVSFGYVDGHRILHDVSIHARPGEIIAFAGSSGAGKSTLVNLVPRFYDPQQGRILLDGVDLRDLRVSDLRQQIGIVPQETQLFSGTVEENIAYARPDATHDEIRAAACAANADEFIRLLPESYGTVVGERGAKLSGGQRQRIAIARAVLKDPSILILDEATSSLDPESEKLVGEALERLMEGRTTLVIAHRHSTLQRAHRIYVIDGGRIVEEGREDHLLEKGGVYSRLFHLHEFDEGPQPGRPVAS